MSAEWPASELCVSVAVAAPAGDWRLPVGSRSAAGAHLVSDRQTPARWQVGDRSSPGRLRRVSHRGDPDRGASAELRTAPRRAAAASPAAGATEHTARRNHRLVTATALTHTHTDRPRAHSAAQVERAVPRRRRQRGLTYLTMTTHQTLSVAVWEVISSRDL